MVLLERDRERNNNQCLVSYINLFVRTYVKKKGMVWRCISKTTDREIDREE